MIYRAVEDPHNGYWNIVTVADDDAVAMVWEKADAFAIVSALNGSDFLDAALAAATGSILSPYAAEKIRAYAREMREKQCGPQHYSSTKE